ncbi:MAG: ABC transporter permease [Verrucomicrobia bacterium]|nr:ABC transporter permease [Verrucomicrobiota bacterium]
MFELSVALKYLIPRKKQLSVSLIALLSVAVISLVVWLVLVFLSVTEGIERNWLQKLTTLNAPVRITPTAHYYASYYYQIDGIAAETQYSLKSIAEKAELPSKDPYDPSEDGELPAHFPQADLTADGSLKDPVKGLFTLLSQLRQSQPDIAFQDFELSGALMRLQLLRPGNGMRGDETQGYLTQVSYLASLPDKCPGLSSLLLPPTEKDLNHLLYLASHSTELSRQDSPALTLKTGKDTAQSRTQGILQNVIVKQLKPRYPFWQLPLPLFPSEKPFDALAHFRNGRLSRIDVPTDKARAIGAQNHVKIWKEGSDLVLQDKEGRQEKIARSTPILVDGPFQLNVDNSTDENQLFFNVQGALQGVALKGGVSLEGLEIAKADFISKNNSQTPWVNLRDSRLPVNEEKETGVLLAKSFLESGVMIGDRGYLSYSSTTASSVQEHRLPIFVSGFYDPGILSVGNKCILVPPFVTRAINSSSTSFNLDKTQSNGILVWFNDLNQAEELKNQILLGLTAQGLDQYWKVTTFREYDFAKDLMEQFQSDKYLFTLVGIIILTVACCNIISMLVLLVNDKKREIGILQAMGASRFSIAAIFGICGMSMGILSSIVGTAAALFTLQNIDSIVQLLSFIQGHDAFNTTFFGKSLPGELSHNAVTFILIATPFLSLLAGLVPAIKACRLRPSEILRAE